MLLASDAAGSRSTGRGALPLRPPPEPLCSTDSERPTEEVRMEERSSAVRGLLAGDCAPERGDPELSDTAALGPVRRPPTQRVTTIR